ncbi:MAG: AMP-binding protein [Puniceicoccales bacterium]|jgi:acyl-coenzyme A synthetase/AMP-(fatty) acid ligase|nr:AMP-binding protein [Puniceicoccales bacterium]
MRVFPLKFEEILDAPHAADKVVSIQKNGTKRTFGQFKKTALALAEILSSRREKSFALCFDNAALHAAAFLAAYRANKNVVLPGHNRAAVLNEQHAAGAFDAILTDLPLATDCLKIHVGDDMSGEASLLDEKECHPTHPLNSESAEESNVTFFTSGSSGVSKKVSKTRAQLRVENELHAAHWGQRLPGSAVLGTTSHLHLYGFQFRVLLPLSMGVPFNEHLIEYHEQLHGISSDFCLVSSPAFLKRLDTTLTPLQCRFILCAGGVLPPETALLAQKILGVAPLEIFGSTEAGAMAWRDTAIDREFWTPLPGVEIKSGDDGRLSIRSPFLPDSNYLLTDDKIETKEDGRFRLAGRLDRVVKIEEKRVSLVDVETRLRAIEGIDDVAALPLTVGTRTFIAAVLVLDKTTLSHFRKIGVGKFLLEIRGHLRETLEPVAIPRRIRVVPRIPESTQGKRHAAALESLFLPEKPLGIERIPCPENPSSVILKFKLDPDLIWFRGHFATHPLLPGVAQLRWAEHFATEMLAPDLTFSHLVSLKFLKPLVPNDTVRLQLNLDAGAKLLEFSYKCGEETASFGKIRMK